MDDTLSPSGKNAPQPHTSSSMATETINQSGKIQQNKVGADGSLSNLLTLTKPVTEMTGADLAQLFGHSLKSPESKRAIRECVAEEIDPLQKRLQSVELCQKETIESQDKLSERIVKVESEVTSLRNTPPTTQQTSNSQHEAIAKRSNIIVSGIDFTENESTRNLISDLLSDIDIKLDGSFQVKRIGPKGKQNQILVEFSCHWDKRKVYAARLKLKNAGREGVFINEDLTKDQKHIFYEARQALKNKLISTAWTYDGITHISRDAPGGGGKVQMAAIPTLEILQQRLPNHKVAKPKLVSANLKWNSVPPKIKVVSPSASSTTLVPDDEKDLSVEQEEGEIVEDTPPRKSPRVPKPKNKDYATVESSVRNKVAKKK